jgi:predicted phage terminase large subunit-like protein
MPPVIQQIVLSADCSFKDLKSSDFVVLQVWGRLKADIYLLDQVRARLSFVTTLAGMKAVCIAWPRMSMKLVEDKANGTAVIDTLKREIPGLIAIDPEGGKVTRAHAASPIIEAGNVFLPGLAIALERARYWRKIAETTGSWLDPRYVPTRTMRNDALGIDMAEWMHSYIEEHAAFPAGSNDDQVDATTQVINRIYQPGRETKPLSKTTPSAVVAAIGGDY